MQDKSALFFGKKCPVQVKQSVKNLLGLSNEAFNDSYLGMPIEVGKFPTKTFKFLIDRAWASIFEWSQRPISRAEKEALLKSII